MGFQTLMQPLEAQSTGEGSITFIGVDNREQTFSYATLYQRALRILHFFQSSGVQRGDELILCVESERALVDALWACLLGGMVPVPLAAGGSKEHRRRVLGVLATLHQPALFTERRQHERLAAYADEQGRRSLLDAPRTLLLENIAADVRPGEPHGATPDDIALIQFSSGSTGDPKGVVLTHRNMLSNIYSICESVNFSSADSMLSWMPLTHDMGLVGFHLLPLVVGMRQYILPTESFGRRPAQWIEKTSEKRVTALGSPNFGYQHLLRARGKLEHQSLDLSRVRLIFNGGEPISPGLCREFLNALAPHGLQVNVMFPVYGMAEATLAVTFPQPGAELEVIHAQREALNVGDAVRVQASSSATTVSLVNVGKPITGMSLRIVDDRNSPMAEGQVGHVQIRGDSVTGGYYRRGGQRKDGFTEDGWLETGDLGAFINGLYVVGRRKETIIVNGQNFHPHDLDRVCETANGHLSGKLACVGIRERDAETDGVAVFVQHGGSLENFAPVVHLVKEAIGSATGLDVREVIPIQSLPRTTSGKIQRVALSEGFRRGQHDDSLSALRAIMNASGNERLLAWSAMERTLKDICETTLKNCTIAVNDNLIDSGADSLALTVMLEAINERYPDALRIEDFLDYPTIAELAAFLEKKVNASGRRALS